VSETPGAAGNVVRFTLPGTHRHWTLTPQANVGDARPDFLLETTDMNVPAVAVFADGHAYHATAAVNRLAEDAGKRTNLRGTGLVVLAVTSHDVTTGEGTDPPTWYNPDLAGNLMNVPPFQAPPEAYRTLGRGPVDWLVDWVSQPQPNAVRNVARAVPMFLSKGAQPVLISGTASLAEVARAGLLDEPLPTGPRQVYLHRRGALATVVEMVDAGVVHVAAVLDDRDQALDDVHADAWRAWLRLSNALALRDWPTTVTTTSLVAPTAADTADGRPRRLLGAWAAAYEAAAPGEERNLVAALATEAELVAPVVGAEGPDGIPLDLAWPDRQVAVAFEHMPATDRADLAAAGWQVVEPSPELIVAALANAGRQKTGGR
jgi:hypothetical protein